MLLNKSQILEADDLPTIEVEVPEWGGSVRLKALRLADLISFQAARSNASNAEATAFLVSQSIVDEAGERVFEQGDVPALTRKNAKVIDRLADAALALNKMGAKHDEDRAKNS